MSSSTATRILNFNEPVSTSSRPAHWLDDKGTGFQNPWASWRYVGPSEFAKVPFEFISNGPKIPKDIDNILPVRAPTWGKSPDKFKIQATWLGHACFFLEMPAPDNALRGARVLFDPVFSDRCSPSQWIGPKRFTKPPCKIEQIPDVDAVIISHNHYDHMDTRTLKTLLKRDPIPHIFAPLGNGAYFEGLGAPKDHVHILD
jgi:N-acyl-phosphatidylethanolamine-hydrolysing phospholipase D